MVRRLVFIGGGPSSLCVLLRMAELVQRPRTDGAAPERFEIVLVDRAGETGGGAPHAATVSAALLLNDSITATEASGLGLVTWLTTNRARWEAMLVNSGDPRATRWLERHREEIDRHAFGGLFLPRLVFGQFLRELWSGAVEALARSGIAVSVVAAEVEDVVSGGSDRWQVRLVGHDPLDAAAVLLAVGNVTATAPDAVADHPGYAGFEIARELRTAEPRLAARLAALPAGSRRIVVLGSSAAATEFLYAAEGASELDGLVDELVVLSPSGRIPDGLCSSHATPFALRRMPALLAATDGDRRPPDSVLTAAAVVDAVVADVAEAQSRGYTIVDLLPAARAAPPTNAADVSHWFRQLFALLSPAEKREFVNTEYKAYRETIRHTSTDYAEAVARLRDRGCSRYFPREFTGCNRAPTAPSPCGTRRRGGCRRSRLAPSWTAEDSRARPKGHTRSYRACCAKVPSARTKPAAGSRSTATSRPDPGCSCSARCSPAPLRATTTSGFSKTSRSSTGSRNVSRWRRAANSAGPRRRGRRQSRRRAHEGV